MNEESLQELRSTMRGTMFKVLPESEQLDDILRCILICNDAVRARGRLQCSS